MVVDITFEHQGLATTTLALTVLTTVTGLVLLWTRYGNPPRGIWQTVVRWAHVVFGVFMALYMVATYTVVPL
ncbi:MAG: hypothetical protein ACOCY7_02645 [Halodesulfurarchaeum sp.]